MVWVKRWRMLSTGLSIVLLLIMVAGSTGLSASTDKSGAADDSVASSKHKGDYLPAHNFTIEIDGVISGGFKEVTGLESEVEVVEYRDGDDPITHKRAGKAKYKNIVLKVDPADPSTKELAAWYDQVTRGKVVRKKITVILSNTDGQQIARYNLYEAWPCRWKAPELNSSSDTHLLEEIEFVVERVERG
jgi:phage tail-like protein